MTGGHHHHHNHGHHHHAHAAEAGTDFGRAFMFGILLNLGFVAVEAIYGFLSNSVALLADAGHNLGDVLGLVVAWVASVLSRRPPTPRYTYGLGGSSILAALFNALFLLVAVGAIAWEAVGRLSAPQPVAGGTMIVVAAIGIVVNGLTAWLFAAGRAGDINIRGAFLHMLADAAVSAGVVVAGLVILATGWLWIDPVVSLVVVGVILWGTWDLFRQALAMSLGAVPPAIEPADVKHHLARLPGVASVHDLHIWPMSTTDVALTCHLIMPAGHPGDGFLMQVSHGLGERFGIGHATLQIEISPETPCALAPEHVV